jgi:hypothetical protein
LDIAFDDQDNSLIPANFVLELYFKEILSPRSKRAKPASSLGGNFSESITNTFKKEELEYRSSIRSNKPIKSEEKEPPHQMPVTNVGDQVENKPLTNSIKQKSPLETRKVESPKTILIPMKNDEISTKIHKTKSLEESKQSTPLTSLRSSIEKDQRISPHVDEGNNSFSRRNSTENSLNISGLQSELLIY